MSIQSRTLVTTALCAGLAGLVGAPRDAIAAPLMFVASGQFDASVPTSYFTAPMATWSVSYTLDSNPAVINTPGAVEVGYYTTVEFSNFSYALNGVTIAESAQSVAFYNLGNGGGADFVFTDRFSGVFEPLDGVAFWGPQAYSGSETSPTMLPGSYPTFLGQGPSFAVVVDEVLYWQPGATFALVALPSPGSLALLLAAALAAAAGRFRRAGVGVSQPAAPTLAPGGRRPVLAEPPWVCLPRSCRSPRS